MKRIVTGHDANGKAIFVSVAEPTHVVEVTAMQWNEVWATFPADTLPVPNPAHEPSRDPRWTSVFPRTGESRCRIIEYRPEQVKLPLEGDLWTADEIATVRRELPGTLEALEPEHFGMHTTDTVDYGIVLSGRIELELDDGATAIMEAGDVVVQNGTRHAWRALENTKIAFVQIGVDRRSDAATGKPA